jgi:hypothetical protein
LFEIGRRLKRGDDDRSKGVQDRTRVRGLDLAGCRSMHRSRGRRRAR